MLKAIILHLQGINEENLYSIPYLNDLIKDLEMKEIGYSIVKSELSVALLTKTMLELDTAPDDCMMIVDTCDASHVADSAGIISIGYLNPCIKTQNLSKSVILVEGFDEIDYSYLNRIYQHSNLKPLTILTTDQFIIRELSTEDIDDLYRIYMKPGIREYIEDFDDNLEVEKEKLHAYIKNIYHIYGFGLWGVFFKESGRLIGRCGIEYKIVDGEAVYEVGYLLDPQYQGNGYAKGFVMEILRYCFIELNMHRILAVIDIKNHRSIHLAEQVGMKKIGECIRNHKPCYKYEITYHV